MPISNQTSTIVNQTTKSADVSQEAKEAGVKSSTSHRIATKLQREVSELAKELAPIVKEELMPIIKAEAKKRAKVALQKNLAKKK